MSSNALLGITSLAGTAWRDSLLSPIGCLRLQSEQSRGHLPAGDDVIPTSIASGRQQHAFSRSHDICFAFLIGHFNISACCYSYAVQRPIHASLQVVSYSFLNSKLHPFSSPSPLTSRLNLSARCGAYHDIGLNHTSHCYSCNYNSCELTTLDT